MEVPLDLPHPQTVMLAGLFEFGDVDTNFWTFVGSALMIPLSGVMWYITRNITARNLLVVMVFFELLSFPVLKRLTSVFSCTSTEVWMEGERFCQLPNTTVEGEQCMDNDPSTQCWESTHLGYLLVVMVLLPPYYLATLNLQLAAQVIAQRLSVPILALNCLLGSQARQSVVVIDGMWIIVATQCKFMLAFLASAFGGCYPIM